MSLGRTLIVVDPVTQEEVEELILEAAISGADFSVLDTRYALSGTTAGGGTPTGTPLNFPQFDADGNLGDGQIFRSNNAMFEVNTFGFPPSDYDYIHKESINVSGTQEGGGAGTGGNLLQYTVELQVSGDPGSLTAYCGAFGNEHRTIDEIYLNSPNLDATHSDAVQPRFKTSHAVYVHFAEVSGRYRTPLLVASLDDLDVTMDGAGVGSASGFIGEAITKIIGEPLLPEQVDPSVRKLSLLAIGDVKTSGSFLEGEQTLAVKYKPNISGLCGVFTGVGVTSVTIVSGLITDIQFGA